MPVPDLEYERIRANRRLTVSISMPVTASLLLLTMLTRLDRICSTRGLCLAETRTASKSSWVRLLSRCVKTTRLLQLISGWLEYKRSLLVTNFFLLQELLNLWTGEKRLMVYQIVWILFSRLVAVGDEWGEPIDSASEGQQQSTVNKIIKQLCSQAYYLI